MKVGLGGGGREGGGNAGQILEGKKAVTGWGGGNGATGKKIHVGTGRRMSLEGGGGREMAYIHSSLHTLTYAYNRIKRAMY